jgi:hypothetical protein
MLVYSRFIRFLRISRISDSYRSPRNVVLPFGNTQAIHLALASKQHEAVALRKGFGIV